LLFVDIFVLYVVIQTHGPLNPGFEKRSRVLGKFALRLARIADPGGAAAVLRFALGKFPGTPLSPPSPAADR